MPYIRISMVLMDKAMNDEGLDTDGTSQPIKIISGYQYDL